RKYVIPAAVDRCFERLLVQLFLCQWSLLGRQGMSFRSGIGTKWADGIGCSRSVVVWVIIRSVRGAGRLAQEEPLTGPGDSDVDHLAEHIAVVIEMDQRVPPGAACPAPLLLALDKNFIGLVKSLC